MNLLLKLLQKHREFSPASTLAAETRRKLQQEAAHRTRKAAQQLLAEDDAEAAARDLKWTQQAQEILSATARPPRRIYPAAAVALVCALLAGLALGLRTGNNPVLLEAELDDLSLHLAADLPWKRADLDIDARRIRETNVQDLDAPGLGLKGPVSSLNLSAEVSRLGAEIQLRELSASASAQLTVHIPDYPRLDIKNGVLAGRIEANQVRLDITDPDGSRDHTIRGPVPETLNFITRHSSTAPAQLMLESTESWHLDGMRVQGLAFAREAPPGSGHWVSTLLSAKLRLLETGKEIPLHANDWLKLGKVQGHRLAIDFDPKKPDRFKLRFNGTVEKVAAGPDGFVNNRAPTWLEYLYHQQQLTLFWSALVFMWGMFWSVRNLL